MTDEAHMRAHTDDPVASHEAAAAVGDQGALKHAILVLLTTGPSAAFELIDRYAEVADRLDWPAVQPHSVARRLSELHRDGLVEDTGERIPSPWGRNATVWRVVDRSSDSQTGEKP